MKGPIRKMLNTLRGDRRYEYWSAASHLQWKTTYELRAMQLQLLQSLVFHAYETTIYYRVVMDGIGIKPSDILSFEDFAELPLLTKDVIRQQEDNLISSAFKKVDLIRNSSGGSTGEPVAFYQNKKLWDMMNGTMMLCQSFMGWTSADMVINIWGNPKDSGKKPKTMRKIRSWIGGSIILNAYEYNRDVLADWIREIRRHGRVFIYGYPSVLTDFADYILELKLELLNVKGVMSSAEKLYEWQRVVIARAFSCPVFDQYGSREVPGIACECDQGNMHMLTYASYIEFIPDQQMNTTKIIATSLANEGMPFLRYEIGDCGDPLEGICDCGRGFPLMKMDIGRIYDSFVTLEGSYIHGAYFVRLLAAVKGLKAFQFHQVEVDLICLKVVRGEKFSDESIMILNGLEGRIRNDVSPSFSLDVQFVNAIPKTGGGKHRYTICEVGR